MQSPAGPGSDIDVHLMPTFKRPPSEYELQRLDDEFETLAKPQSDSELTRTRRKPPAAPEPAAGPAEPVEYTRSSEQRAARRPRRGQTEGSGDEPQAGKTESSARKGPSLKMRAVGYLSRREHSRAELARKLKPYAESADEIEAVLDALQKEGWQSNARYAQSVVHRKAPRQGTARIIQELRQSGVEDSEIADLREGLRASEYERALDVWRRRFGEKPADRTVYAKQARFLASRGFAHDVIRRILGGSDDDEF